MTHPQEAGKTDPAIEMRKRTKEAFDKFYAGTPMLLNDPERWHYFKRFYSLGFNEGAVNEASKYAQQREQPAPTPESQWPTEDQIEKGYKDWNPKPTGFPITEFQTWKACAQWLQTSGVREGTREGELRECLGILINLIDNAKIDAAEYPDLIAEAKSLLSKTN